MNNHSFNPGNNGYQYGKREDNLNNSSTRRIEPITQKRDEDLIIEENTIYEIDRDCFDRLKKQKKKK